MAQGPNLSSNPEAKKWYKKFLEQKVLTLNSKEAEQILAEKNNKQARTIDELRSQIKAIPSTDSDREVAKLLQRTIDLEVEVDNWKASCKAWEFIFGESIPDIALPVPQVSESLMPSTRARALATEKFPHTVNPPKGLDEKVVGDWCRRVKFEIGRYYESKNKEDTLRRINVYISQNFQLKEKVYRLQKRVSDLEEKNRMLERTHRAYERAFNTQFSSADDSDVIKRREIRLKKILCVCIGHLKNPAVAQNLTRAVGEAE